MAERWKEVWEDFISALRGEAPSETGAQKDARDTDEVAPVDTSLLSEKTAAELPLAPDSPVPIPVTASYDEADPNTPAPSEAEGVAPPGAVLSAPQRWLEQLQTGGLYASLIAMFFMGLWFAGGDRLWAQWAAPRPPAPDVIATFDGGQLTVADLEEHFNLLVPEDYRAELRTLETLRQVVQEMVADELARKWASEQKLDADATFQHTMEHITEAVNLDSFSTQLRAGRVPVAESEIQAYYDTNREQFGDQPLGVVRDQISQQLVASQETAYLQDYIDRLKENASITRNFELLNLPAPSETDLLDYYQNNLISYTVPARYSVDLVRLPITADEATVRTMAEQALLKLRSGVDLAAISTAVAGAEVYTDTVVMGDMFGPEWELAVKPLLPGELTGVVRTPGAFVIARLLRVQPAGPKAFAEARTEVLAPLQTQLTEDWINANAGKTLFTIKSKQYTLGQFYGEYKELASEVQAQFVGPEGLQQLAELLIERLVLVEDTYSQLLDVKNKDLIDQMRLDVLKQMMDQQEVDDQVEVSEGEIQQYYAENSSLMVLPPQYRIRYIRIGLGQTADEQREAQAQANEAYQKLVPGLFQQGRDFVVVAQEYSEDPETAANGGELPGWVGETGDPFEPPDLHLLHETLLSLNIGDISLPVIVGDSLYIVQVIDRQEPTLLSFEQAQPYIEDLLREEKHDALLRQFYDQLSQQMNLVIYEGTLEDYISRVQLTPSAPNQQR